MKSEIVLTNFLLFFSLLFNLTSELLFLKNISSLLLKKFPATNSELPDVIHHLSHSTLLSIKISCFSNCIFHRLTQILENKVGLKTNWEREWITLASFFNFPIILHFDQSLYFTCSHLSFFIFLRLELILPLVS